MRMCFLMILSIVRVSFELPNGVEKAPKPDDGYSDWFNVFYKTSSLIPLLKSSEKTYYAGIYFRVTFLQAQLFCKLMHMHLITVTSEKESNEIGRLLEKNNITGNFWTSGTRMLDGNTWIWMSTARRINYEKWGTGQPNNKNDHCIMLMKDLYWNDRNCNCRFFFICEKPVDEFSLYISKKHESEIRKYYRTYFD